MLARGGTVDPARRQASPSRVKTSKTESDVNAEMLEVLISIRKWQQMSTIAMCILAVSFVTLTVTAGFYVQKRVDPIVTEVQQTVKNDLPKIVGGVVGIVDQANTTMSKRAPVWFHGIDSAFAAFEPRFGGYASNAATLLDKFAAQNITLFMQRGERLLQIVNALFLQPMLKNPLSVDVSD
jgi:hypothetical protein